VASRHDVRLQLPDRPVRVAAHDDLVDRALGNLLDNAVVHGGRHVVVTVAVERGGAVVRVCDDGCGIAAEELPHVFERFWRGSAARGRSGTGLGLAIAAAAARAMDGELTVDSRPGETTFQLRIPLAAAVNGQAVAPGQAAARTRL
jgi:signal transduction histidine kinase